MRPPNGGLDIHGQGIWLRFVLKTQLATIMKTAAMFLLFLVFAILGNVKAIRFSELYAFSSAVTLSFDVIVAGALTILFAPLLLQ